MARRFLIFRCGADDYALPLQDVAEVMEPRQTFPLPMAPPSFRGIINLHGTLTAVLDLSHFLNGRALARQGKFLALDARLASLALSVDAVGSIVGEDSLVARHPSDDPLLEGVLETERGEVKLLRVEALLARLEEGVAAAAPVQGH